MSPACRVACFDDTHGSQWGQTGFPSRELHSNCAGLAEVLRGLGCDCTGVRHACFLIVCRTCICWWCAAHRLLPSLRQTWQRSPLVFTSAEVRDILRSSARGTAVAFAYRFGDAFTRTNLQGDLLVATPYRPARACSGVPGRSS